MNAKKIEKCIFNSQLTCLLLLFLLIIRGYRNIQFRCRGKQRTKHMLRCFSLSTPWLILFVLYCNCQISLLKQLCNILYISFTALFSGLRCSINAFFSLVFSSMLHILWIFLAVFTVFLTVGLGRTGTGITFLPSPRHYMTRDNDLRVLLLKHSTNGTNYI